MSNFRTEVETVSKYDGNGGRERAVVVYSRATGRCLAVARRRPFEAKAAWVKRAEDAARMEVA